MEIPKMYVIRNTEGLYWNSTWGWGDSTAATVLCERLGRPMDGKWVEVTPWVQAALDAAALLIEAYDHGEKNGGNIDWEDVDVAYRKALEMEIHR